MAAPKNDEAKPRRKNKPEYVVFRLTSFYSPEQREKEGKTEGIEAWVPVLGHAAQAGVPKTVQASSRKEAIVKATAGTDDPALTQGAFMVVPAAEAQIIKRKSRVEVVDDFE